MHTWGGFKAEPRRFTARHASWPWIANFCAPGNRLPDRLTHPWPGLRQTGITRVPAGVVFEAGLQTSPDFSRRFSSLSVAFRGKAEEDDLGWLHLHTETLGFRASLSRCCTRSISSPVAWDLRFRPSSNLERNRNGPRKCVALNSSRWKLLLHEEEEIWLRSIEKN